jgi:hypothetical protein
MRLDSLVLTAGARTSADGRVVAIGGKVTFEPPLPVALAAWFPGHEPAPRASHLGVAVEGVDTAALARRREKDGAVEGWAHLSGVWLGDRLQVEAQEPKHPVTFEHRRSVDWRHPPGSAPAGGWPHGPEDDNFDLADQRFDGGDGLIVALAQFRPSPTQVVLVIAASDPAQAERELRPRFGSRLCVVASRWTRRQVDAVRVAAAAHMSDWQLYYCGETVTEDGQAIVTIGATRVGAELLEWAAAIPGGLLGVDAWLSPDSG